jgi:hypothetical protein
MSGSADRALTLFRHNHMFKVVPVCDEGMHPNLFAAVFGKNTIAAFLQSLFLRYRVYF